MTKLQELINELCPNGVEYRKLGEIGTFKKGKGFSKDAIGKGNEPIILYGELYTKYGDYISNTVSTTDWSFEKNPVFAEENDLLFPVSSTTKEAQIGKISVYRCKYKCALGGDAFVFRQNQNPSYIMYLMNSPLFEKQKMKCVKGTTINHLDVNKLQKISIPLPPLSVQCEIVRILDRFAEYAAELQARKEQYEYYRNKLLTFNEIQGGVVWKKMSEIGTFYGGLTGKSKKDFVDGNAKFITYMNVYSNIALKTDVNDKVCIAEGEKQNTIQYGDALFTGSSETPDECGMSSVLTIEPKEPLYLNSFCFGFRLNDRETYYPDFLKHLLRSSSVRKQIGKTANGVTRFNVSKKLLEKIKLPLPPLSEQRRIADILDRFDVLTNDLVAGLPAEIAAVKEQYEYYRNKLLTFERLSA